MKTAIIYALCEPNTRTIRYIGQTVRALNVRLRQHSVRCRTGGSNHLACWLRSLENQTPTAIKLSEVPIDSRFDEEIRYIQAARYLGFNLVNATDGGEGCLGYKTSEETKEKLRLANLGKTQSEETRKKIGRKGRIISNETKKRMSEGQKAAWSRPRKIREIYKRAGAKSSFLGVSWKPGRGQCHWCARITLDKKRIFVGNFQQEQDAARAYDGAAKQYFGPLAKLNFQE